MGRRVWGPGGRCVSRAILGTGTVPASFRDPLACLPRPALVQRVQRGTRQAPEDRRPGKRPGGPRGQRVWLLVPEGCGCGAAGPGGQPWPPVLAEPPGRDGAMALPGGGGEGGSHPAAANARGGLGRQACIRSERCPICWNPLSTLADPLSALGETSPLYCRSQR